MKYWYSDEILAIMEQELWLTDRERAVFDLYYRRGWHIEDIAAEIDRQRSAVDRILKHIRKKMYEKLQPRFEC